eukprot:CAMPEP_0115870294 /NCGR_PEP_ID=MMETSP0287-20121206/22249_1 /TAXON_ID=412157 /ORGANISM="Chrysochromulina rotalis, Strain UIO044" /LENGTH=66 /DNA_ID=CAMNT_0003325005 /DNA_START=92 /DNA_END=288 /DNA_ORIENTATION=+
MADGTPSCHGTAPVVCLARVLLVGSAAVAGRDGLGVGNDRVYGRRLAIRVLGKLLSVGRREPLHLL